jgi:hypothetical protein
MAWLYAMGILEWSKRSWEARWRDADAEVRRLQKAIAVLEREIARLEEVVATLIPREKSGGDAR